MALIDYAIVFVYLTAMIILGVMLQKKASAGIDSFFLGDRGIPWWALGASGMASNLDVTGTMINTAWIFALGATGMFIEIRGGVTLIMAFLMIFMGKWNRRARVMTMAEWMHFRFGTKREGDVARLMSAVSIIVIIIAMVTYFAVGSGKFISTFLGIPDIGKVTQKMSTAKMYSFEQYMMLLDSQIKKAETALTENSMNVPEINSVRKNFLKVDKNFFYFKRHSDSLPIVKRLETELESFSNSVYALTFTVGDANPEVKEITDTLHQWTAGMKTLFNSNTSYKVYVKAQFIAALMMIFLAMIYTVASGLYGVVWTDVFQGILIFGTIIYICVLALTRFNIPDVFSVSIPLRDGTFQAIQTTRDAWTSVIPQWKLAFPAESTYSIYNLFGVAILFYLIKVAIEGAGGTSGYMIQRYFAAKSDRDAGLLSLFWTFLLSFRWPFIAAIALMGVAFGTTQGVISDPETVLPIVVNELIPVGLKGLLVAGLMAAAMSTFDSTVNAGASYWVKDIYQAYINPKADSRKLMLHSRWATVAIVILGLLFSISIQNINEIWGWITMSIGAGMMIPTLVRWYWWRLNGWGFAIGTAAGMVAAVLQRLLFPDVPEYVSFSFASGISFIAMIIGTYATPPTEDRVLFNFYKTTRPFGFWKHIKEKMPVGVLSQIHQENSRDKRSIFLAVPWQIVLFLMWITVIMRRWDMFAWLLGLLVILSAGLYFWWFRHLSTEVDLNATE